MTTPLAIGRPATVELLQLFGALTPPETDAALRQLLADQHWTIAAEIDDEVIIADGPWGAGGNEITITYTDKVVTDISVGVFTSTDNNPVTQAHASDIYTATVDDAIGLWCPASGAIEGQRPRTWWTFDHATVSVSRFDNAVVVAWWTPAHATWFLSTLDGSR